MRVFLKASTPAMGRAHRTVLPSIWRDVVSPAHAEPVVTLCLLHSGTERLAVPPAVLGAVRF